MGSELAAAVAVSTGPGIASVAGQAPTVGAGLGGAMGGWLPWLMVMVVIPWVWPWLQSRGIALIIEWQMRKLLTLLDANSGDAAWDDFLEDVGRAVIKLAQRKFPADGMGPERKKWIIKTLTRKVPVLRGREQQVGEFLDALVAKERELLNQLSARAATPTTPPAAPDSAPSAPGGPAPVQ